MATPSDDELPFSMPLPPTWSKRKSGSGVLSDESDSAPEPAKEKRGCRQRTQSDSDIEEVIQKPPKKKPGPKPKRKAVSKAKSARAKKAVVSDAESIDRVEKEKPSPCLESTFFLG
ncbi:hypothetical protein GGX14DRAFT_395344 [Mycena pura]|uniref:Uncharacterized protein n=1 Tax=Mycena pura TaxID=153505 RepID=A0AAD6VGK0_9AGAR|nr:hypothetical protein GGX14DRAFT_395344 [Mycena pura]